MGSLVGWALKARPRRTTWFQPGSSFSCSGGLAVALLGCSRGVETQSFWPHSPCVRVAAATFVSLSSCNSDNFQCGCSLAEAFKFLLWGFTDPWRVRISRHASGCLATFMLCMPEELAAFALDRRFQSSVRLHLYLQAAEFGERSYFHHNRASRHRHDKVRC
jgi:hypothetical protein